MADPKEWYFNEPELTGALESWSARQLSTYTKIMQIHVDYMKASILAFLYSREGRKLRLDPQPNKGAASNENQVPTD